MKKRIAVGITFFLCSIGVVIPTAWAAGLIGSAQSSPAASSGSWGIAPVNLSTDPSPGGAALSVVFGNTTVTRIQFIYLKNYGSLSLISSTFTAVGIPATRNITISTCAGTWDTTNGGNRGKCSAGGTGVVIGSALTPAANISTLSGLAASAGTSDQIKLVLNNGSGTVNFSSSALRSQVQAAITQSS